MAMKKAPKLSNVVSSPKEDNRSTLYISEKELPAIKDWNLKKKYLLEVEVEMTGKQVIDTWSSTPGKIRGAFRINKITVDDDKDEK